MCSRNYDLEDCDQKQECLCRLVIFVFFIEMKKICDRKDKWVGLRGWWHFTIYIYIYIQICMYVYIRDFNYLVLFCFVYWRESYKSCWNQKQNQLKKSHLFLLHPSICIVLPLAHPLPFPWPNFPSLLILK